MKFVSFLKFIYKIRLNQINRKKIKNTKDANKQGRA